MTPLQLRATDATWKPQSGDPTKPDAGDWGHTQGNAGVTQNGQELPQCHRQKRPRGRKWLKETTQPGKMSWSMAWPKTASPLSTLSPPARRPSGSGTTLVAVLGDRASLPCRQERPAHSAAPRILVHGKAATPAPGARRQHEGPWEQGREHGPRTVQHCEQHPAAPGAPSADMETTTLVPQSDWGPVTDGHCRPTSAQGPGGAGTGLSPPLPDLRGVLHDNRACQSGNQTEQRSQKHADHEHTLPEVVLNPPAHTAPGTARALGQTGAEGAPGRPQEGPRAWRARDPAPGGGEHSRGVEL